MANSSNSASSRYSRPITTNNARGALEQIVVPTANTSNAATTTTTTTTTSQFSSTGEIAQELSANPSALNSYVAKSLNTEAIPGITLASYNALDATGKQEIKQSLVNKIARGGKAALFATQALNQSKAGTFI